MGITTPTTNIVSIGFLISKRMVSQKILCFIEICICLSPPQQVAFFNVELFNSIYNNVRGVITDRVNFQKLYFDALKNVKNYITVAMWLNDCV